MLVSSKYYLYRHIRTDKNEPFYIGKGSAKKGYGHRLVDYKGRSELWLKIYEKCNKEIITEIIYETDNQDFIVEKEKEFIALYGRIDLGTGSLANLTNGGEGCVGKKVSNEQISKFLQTIKSSRVWSSPSAETKKRMSQSHKERYSLNKSELSNQFSERSKKTWLNIEYRNKVVAAIKLRSSQPSYKIKLKEQLKYDRETCDKLIDKRDFKIENGIFNGRYGSGHTTPLTEETKIKISAKLKGTYYKDTKLKCEYKGEIEYFKSIKDVSKRYRVSVKKLMYIISENKTWQGISVLRIKKSEI